MSVTKKLLSAVGMGAAKVETEINKAHLVPGEMITASVKVTGGSVAQTVNGIYFYTVGSCRFSDDGRIKYRRVTFDTHRLTDEFTIGPGDVYTTQASFELTQNTPLTVGGNKVYVQTGLDVSLAIDPKDTDEIIVQPGAIVQSMFTAMNDLGFQMYKSDCEEGYKFGRRYIQEFEFRPMSHPFRNKLDEVELVCLASPNSVAVYMQVDRRANGLGGLLASALDADESNLRFTVTQADIPFMKHKLSDLIQTNMHKTFF